MKGHSDVVHGVDCLKVLAPFHPITKPERFRSLLWQ